MYDKNWESKLDIWEEKYKPIDLGGDSGDGVHVDYDTAVKMAKELNPDNPEHHIWTLLEVDDKQFYSSGVHHVNRMDYCVTKNSWEGDASPGSFLEITYWDPEELNSGDFIHPGADEDENGPTNHISP